MGFDLIGSEQRELSAGGVVSTNPARPSEILWSGTPMVSHVGDAVAAAREALGVWARAPIEKRVAVLERFKAIAAGKAGEMGKLISRETGKAIWDASTEGGALASKVDITLATGEHSGRSRVSGFEVGVTDSRVGRCGYRPHGVMAVVGPFNFPAHLPNGHIVPALLMGNTVVFKPSEKTPAVGEALARMYREALEAEGFPAGVVNLVQGGAETSVALTNHDDVDGILFTGSWPVGRKILESNLDRPGRIVALEMGGNNPAVVMGDADLRQALIEVVRGAFITTGQRCTCTRRVIVHESVAERFIGALKKMTASIVVGDPEADGVFFGPPVTREARDAVVSFEQSLAAGGGEVLVPVRTEIDGVDPDAAYVTPGLVRVDRFTADEESGAGCDREVFGPLLRVAVVGSFDEAMEQANATRYGLAASVFTKDESLIERFLFEAKAGASGKLPFGGLGASGNHRPAGASSLDYCAYPVASLIESGDAAGLSQGMGFDEGWVG